MLGGERDARGGRVRARSVRIGVRVRALPPLAEGLLGGDGQVACARPQRGREGQCADGALLRKEARRQLTDILGVKDFTLEVFVTELRQPVESRKRVN